jgi:hypothetical protein
VAGESARAFVIKIRDEEVGIIELRSDGIDTSLIIAQFTSKPSNTTNLLIGLLNHTAIGHFFNYTKNEWNRG